MPLIRLGFQRYRGFARRTELSLRPLTLLFGYNSAGKSAVARALPLLAASSGGSAQSPLALDCDTARGASFDDIKTKLSASRDLSFFLTWDDDETEVGEIEIHVRNEPTPSVPVRQVLTGLVIRPHEDGAIKLTDNPDHPSVFFVDGIDGVESKRIHFEGIRPTSDGIQEESLSKLIDGCARRLSALRNSVHWLCAVRAPLQREIELGTRPVRITARGDEAVEILCHEGDRSPVFSRVRTWIESMFEHRLNLRVESGKHRLELELTGRARGVSVVDVGEGIAQVLPVLVLLALAVEGHLGSSPLVILEQPEMHLHPKAEKSLAEIFVKSIAAESSPRLLVESHSENLLLSVQLELAREFLPEKVALYWLERGDKGECTVKEIDADKDGCLHGWPSGVFSEDVELARKLLIQRRSNRQ